MALIKCKECGKDITDNSTRCPHCGAINTNTTQQSKSNNNQESSSALAGIFALIIVGLIVWGIVSLISKPVEKEGEKLLDAFGVTHEGNDLIIKEKSKSQIKDDVMNWAGFEKIEN